jgi:hypothetical protein
MNTSLLRAILLHDGFPVDELNRILNNLLAARALSVSKESNSGELVCFVFLLLFA